MFELPRSAVALARSKLTDCQAFRYGASAYGFHCHLEGTETIVRRMAKAFRQEVVETATNEHRLFDELPVHLKSLRRVGLIVFERWAQLVLDRAES